GDEIPFILFTGKGREEVVIEALNSGADSYLQKGGKPESQYVELEHRIRAVVRQRRGAQALRESEERYRKVFFSNHDSICITRLSDGMFVSANHGFTEMSGYDEEEIIGKTSLEINLWKDPEDRRKIVEALRTKGEVRDYEARFATKLGEMDGSMSASVIELNGEAHILNVTRDITERKANEATLKDNEERYRQLFEMESDALVLVDKRDGQLLEVNHAAERLYGYDRSELLQMKSTDLSAQVEETARAMKESATSVPLRFHRKKDGSIFPVEITATNYDWRGIPVLICAIRDIAERQRSERALRESEVRFEQLAEHARTVTWEIDADGLFTYVSSVSKVAWGYRPDELVGKKHFFDLIPEAYRRSVKAMTSEAFKRKEQFTDLEGHIQTKDGEVRTVSTNGIPLLNADGTLRGYQGSETDITERKRDELAIRQKNSELQRANEELAAKEGKIREGEVRYRSLFENMLNGFAYCRLLFDSEGLPVDFIYLKVNDAFESITGLRNVEGRNVTDVIPGIRESSPELFEIYSRVAMTGKPETFEIDLKSMNIWLRISVFRAEALSFVAVFENITERKQTEEKLLQISDRLLIAARAGGVGIWDFDVVRNRLTWDGQMFKLYGIQEGQFGGAYDAWKAGLLPEDRQRAELETQMALRGEKEYDTEFRV
ncbi:MAG: PAS domain S-box protein, partial [Methanomassiliicoccales archaeon]